MSNTRPLLTPTDRKLLAFALAAMRDDRIRTSDPLDVQYDNADDLFKRILGASWIPPVQTPSQQALDALLQRERALHGAPENRPASTPPDHATENQLWLIMVSRGGVMIPSCWRPSAKEADDLVKHLNAQAVKHDKHEQYYAFPVGETPR